jgi:glucokinase-like ROK family protein
MKRLNRAAILDLIRKRGPISRTQIAETLELAPSSVTRRVWSLMQEGLVRVHSTLPSTGGRRPELLDLDTEYNRVFGVDIGGHNMRGVIADLRGQVLYDNVLPSRARGTEDGTFGQLVRLLEDLLAHVDRKERTVRGIGVGAPAVVFGREGIVTWAPALGWRDLPLKAMLEDRFDLPVFVENNANLAALGEWLQGAGRGAQDLVFIAIGAGMGAGLVLRGELYRGANEAAGEVGYMITAPDRVQETFDGFGCLEGLAGVTGIARRATSMVQDHPGSMLQQLQEAAGGHLTARDVFAAAQQGDAVGLQLFGETVDYLTMAIANVACLINPEVVVIGGELAEFGEPLLGPVRERLRRLVPFVPEIRASELGELAVAVGAVTIALRLMDEHIFVYERTS